MAECGSCHYEIDWAYSDKPPVPGKRPGRVPVNHDSAGDPKGNLEVWRDGQGVLRYRYLRKGEEPAKGRHRGVTHYATCPDADMWRQRGRAARPA
jgi:hypothetical protein